MAFKLHGAVLSNSISEDWDSALEEWKHIGFDYVQQDGECACGKQHISELNYVKNIYTDAELIIGSECINKFFKYDISNVHDCIKRVIKDKSKSLHVSLICDAYETGLINKWEYSFYLDIKNKRKLTSNQVYKKQFINEKILNKINTIKT